MTREEAIAFGNQVISLGLNDDTQQFAELSVKALEQEPTTKNDLAVEKTDMIDKSNFSQEQYKTDLQSAYDSGYEQAKNDLGVDAVSRKAVHDMLENLPITVEDKWFNWLQKACMRLAELPSVTPQEPRIGKLIGYIDFLRNTAQGKKKSLDLLEKVVKGELEEIRTEEIFINKPCISEGVCKVDAAKMLEHIDEEVRNLFEPDDFGNSGCYNEALVDVLEILNSHARRLTDENNN